MVDEATRVALIGFPSSVGSYAAGQDLAPAALRGAGLVGALRAAGLSVEDRGDLPAQVWHPDREHPRAQNAHEVASGLRGLDREVAAALVESDIVLVLGGNCTVALAAMAALRDAEGDDVGLLYLDRQLDLNTPASTTDGAFDWMGLAHAFDLPGSDTVVAGAFDRRPLLEPRQVAWLGVDLELATAWEREQVSALALSVSPGPTLADHPVDAVRSAMAGLPGGPIAVHIDVDVLDFTDAPLAENTDGRNSGPTLDALGIALTEAMNSGRVRIVSIGELNPTRSAGDPGAIPRFIEMLAGVLGDAAP
jgi:arginase